MAKKFNLARVTVPDSGPEGLWKHIIGKDDLEDHLIERNFEQFSHSRATPFGYTDMGKERVHTGDSQMAQDICEGTLRYAALSDSAIHAIVQKNFTDIHPSIDKILKPGITPEDFKSGLKCVSEKTVLSFS
jgi:hypothetical protein